MPSHSRSCCTVLGAEGCNGERTSGLCWRRPRNRRRNRRSKSLPDPRETTCLKKSTPLQSTLKERYQLLLFLSQALSGLQRMDIRGSSGSTPVKYQIATTSPRCSKGRRAFAASRLSAGLDAIIGAETLVFQILLIDGHQHAQNGSQNRQTPRCCRDPMRE